MQNQNVVFFHHLEKCGGTTLQVYLREHFDEDKTFFTEDLFRNIPYYYQTRYLSPESLEKISECQFVHDHHGVLFFINDPKIKRITFFREPLSRLISHWQMICRRNRDELINFPERLKVHDIAKKGFKDFLLAIKNQYIGAKIFNNFYASHLLYDNVPLRDKYYESFPENLEIYKEACETALNKFTFIGLLEDYDMSLLMLDHHLNFLPNTQVKKLNERDKSQQIPEMDEETLALAEELISLDRYIYQKAKEKYERQKEAFLKSIPRFSTMHAFVEKNHEQNMLKNKPLNTLVFSMSQGMNPLGWYSRETEGNMTWRWTGPSSHAYIDLNLDRTLPLLFNLSVIKSEFGQNVKNLKIIIDNKPIKYKIFDSNDKIMITGIIKKRYFSKKLTQFVFDAQKTVPAPNNDPRLIGIPIESLTIKPYHKDSYEK